MAARRVISLIAAKMSQNPLPREVSRKFYPSPNSFSRSYKQHIRGFQSTSEATDHPVENNIKPDSSISNPSASTVSGTNQTSPSITHQGNSTVKVSEKQDLAMIFSCKACEARSIKTVCRESYEKGVVVARCDACGNLHLIGDRLGWFGEPGSLEEFLAARGEEVKKGSVETFNFMLEDLAVMEEKTSFELKMESFDMGSIVKVIRAIRSFTDLGLKEVKDLVKKAPVVFKKGVSREEAEKIIEKMKAVGAIVVME